MKTMHPRVPFDCKNEVSIKLDTENIYSYIKFITTVVGIVFIEGDELPHEMEGSQSHGDEVKPYSLII